MLSTSLFGWMCVHCWALGNVLLGLAAAQDTAVTARITYIDDDQMATERSNESHAPVLTPAVVPRLALTGDRWDVYTSTNYTLGFNNTQMYGVPILTQQLKIILSRAISNLSIYEKGQKTSYYRYDRVQWSLILITQTDMEVPYGIIHQIASRILFRLPQNQTFTTTRVTRINRNSLPCAQMAFLPNMNNPGDSLDDLSGPAAGDDITTLRITTKGLSLSNSTLSSTALDFWNSTAPDIPHDGKRQIGGALEREVVRRVGGLFLRFAVRVRLEEAGGMIRIFQNHIGTVVAVVFLFINTAILELCFISTMKKGFREEWGRIFGGYPKEHVTSYQKGRILYTVTIRIEYVPVGMTEEMLEDEIWAEIYSHARSNDPNRPIPATNGVLTRDAWYDSSSHAAAWAPAPAPAPEKIYWRIASWAVTAKIVDPVDLKDEL